ncbi:hypothetical protein G7Y89_g4030 [Cudoniella acicularis]|uniref:Aminoglycoside phosphotransferase domain-containing protein n=1 Tax=Cudoniella acicularis TaxID=354080 RepID=A0A8H4W526_9HELO|nr:hypothetical protein G7Y89_g4030 [Cudoniella acicularis]
MESDKTFALRIVQDAKLAHPDLPLVEAFLHDAVDGEQAAKYLLQTCTGDATGANLSSKSLWKILAQRYRQRLSDILGAFTTPSQRDLLKEPNSKNLIRNHWTLSKEAAITFSKGEIRLKKLDTTDVCLSHLELSLTDSAYPDPELLEIHSRFSKALKWTEIAAKMNSHAHLRHRQNTSKIRITQAIASSFLAVWSKFPDIIRFQAYKLLKIAGSYLYRSTTIGIQRLPFGMYLKHGPEVHAERHAGEFNALKLVRSRTSIPVPRPIDLLLSPTESFLVTSRIEGDPAGIAINECSNEEMSMMTQDLRSWIAELHAIRLDTDPTRVISNATGGPCLDYRISTDPVGPFRNEKEFSESLRLGILPDLVHRADHRILFTHSDLNMRNILVKDGKISGIVDWENAGWYPEYWEYTKCHFGVRLSQRWLKMIEAVFENKYEEELEIERQYWEYHSAW